MIKTYLKGNQEIWDLNLGCLAAAYRATPHESTGLTPNLLMLGREVRLPAEVMLGSGSPDAPEVASYGTYVSDLRETMQHAHDVARQHLGASVRRQKHGYDAKMSFHRYEAGDLVWYATQRSQLHLSPKLRNPFEGPFVVLKRVNDLLYQVQFERHGDKQVVHHNKLKPYLGDKVITWAKAAVKKANQ
jgi:hypothetical protein